MRFPRHILVAVDRRRLLIAAILIAAAGAVAAAFIVAPAPSSDSGDTTAPTTTATTMSQTSTTPAGAERAAAAAAPLTDTADKAANSAALDASVGSSEAAATSSTLDPPALDARIVRTASIDLRASRGEFESVWSDSQRTARLFGGYVVSASRSGAGRGPRTGSLTLRVPSARFDQAVDHLRGLDNVKVRQLDVASEDVSQEYVDVQSRLRHDRAVEARLVALLSKARTVGDVLAVQSRLDAVQGRIEQSKGRLDYLTKMTSMSTIDLVISEPGASTTRPVKHDHSRIGAAFADAGERFSSNVATGIVWVGGALPMLLICALALVCARIVWHRLAPSPSSTLAEDPAERKTR